MKKILLKFFLVTVSLCLLSISFFVFRSFQIQSRIDIDFSSEEISIEYEEIQNLFPPIPNISIATIPLDAYKSYYYSRYGNNQKALSILSDLEAKKVNPYLYYVEHLKSIIFISTNQLDSSLIYAKKAFYGWPKNINHYKIYNRLLVAKADTTEIIQAFDYIDSIFYDRSNYGEIFVNSLAAANLMYLAKYNNTIIPKASFLEGSWFEVIETVDRKYDTLSKTMSIKNDIFNTTGIEYKFKIEDNLLNLYSKKNSNYLISSSQIKFDTIYRTLILTPTQRNGEKRDTFFKKVLK